MVSVELLLLLVFLYLKGFLHSFFGLFFLIIAFFLFLPLLNDGILLMIFF